jgi:hypothetical protein
MAYLRSSAFIGGFISEAMKLRTQENFKVAFRAVFMG